MVKATPACKALRPCPQQSLKKFSNLSMLQVYAIQNVSKVFKTHTFHGTHENMIPVCCIVHGVSDTWCVYSYAMNVLKTRFCSLGFQAVGTNMMYKHDIHETETYLRVCVYKTHQTLLRFIDTDKYMLCAYHHGVTHTKQ